MLKHYLKIAARSILKDKGYSTVNIIGLSIAVACCFLLIFWVKFELSYESCYPNAGRIYRLMTEEQREEGKHYNAWIRPAISDQIKETFPQIEATTFCHPETLPFVETGAEEGDGIMAMLLTTQEDYLRIFAFEYVEGSPRNVIQSNGCIMTEETARKFFGNQSAIGKTVHFGHGSDKHKVAAVVKMPANTEIRFDILDPSGRIRYGIHYIMLKKGQKMTRALEEQLAGFLAAGGDTEKQIRVQPIEEIHLHAPASTNAAGRLNQIYLFSLAALLILVVAIINYVNTSIARALNRVKEVGVRKVTGAGRRQLVTRFLFESFILSFIAILLALALTKLCFTAFSEAMGNRIAFGFDGMTVVIALVVCALVSLMSGGYAAFYLSSFDPVYILRGASKTGSKERLRKTLMGLQFFLSISILTCTLVIYKQINAIFNAETGVNRENVIVLGTSLWYKVEDFIKVIKNENPNILDATIASSAPYNVQWNYSGVSWEGSDELVKNMEFSQIFCDHHYADVFGLQLANGEFIPPGLTWWSDATPQSYNIVINETFQRLMGEENPIGLTVNYGYGMKGKIIGIAKDFNFKPLRSSVAPLIISFNPEACSVVYIKTTGQDRQATLDYILAKYKEMKPKYANRPVMHRTTDEEYNNIYRDELRTAKMLSYFSGISFFLSLIGVISMISLMIEKRTKEIAIRKINGARVRDVILLFTRDITGVALVASLVAVPVCFAIMYNWLLGYVYRTTLDWWIFVGVPALVILVTGAIIAVQVRSAARKNPVESLRNE
ncbi:MAG: ABC transporter permease [Odoribacteraceae bacterium]|jgi:putative ABC transport system permease protein|nr:ABC transporter permease [Odoribacteraceae bacterium]